MSKKRSKPIHKLQGHTPNTANPKDLIGLLNFFRRQKDSGRSRVSCDGQLVTPDEAIEYMYQKYPWLR